jgi:hypothetical protein
MTEIKRYAVKQVREDEGGYAIVDVAEHPQGEWVRFTDCQRLAETLVTCWKLSRDPEVSQLIESALVEMGLWRPETTPAPSCSHTAQVQPAPQDPQQPDQQ